MDEKERQYQEYLALRQHQQEEEIRREYLKQEESRGADGYTDGIDEKYGKAFPAGRKQTRRVSVTETPYGMSEMRKAQKEKERRDREMQDYLDSREADRNKRGVRSGIVQTDYDEFGDRRSGFSFGRKKSGSEKKHALKHGNGGRKNRRKLPAPVLAILIALVLLAVTALSGGAIVLATISSAEHISLDKDNLGIDSSVASSLDGYRNIAVLGTYKKQGIATALLKQLICETMAAGVRDLFLEVREHNIPALRLYQKAGFVESGRRRGYYDKPKEDALIMVRKSS